MRRKRSFWHIDRQIMVAYLPIYGLLILLAVVMFVGFHYQEIYNDLFGIDEQQSQKADKSVCTRAYTALDKSQYVDVIVQDTITNGQCECSLYGRGENRSMVFFRERHVEFTVAINGFKFDVNMPINVNNRMEGSARYDGNAYRIEVRTVNVSPETGDVTLLVKFHVSGEVYAQRITFPRASLTPIRAPKERKSYET